MGAGSRKKGGVVRLSHARLLSRAALRRDVATRPTRRRDVSKGRSEEQKQGCCRGLILPGVVVATAVVVAPGAHLHEFLFLPSDTTISPTRHVVGHPMNKRTRTPAQRSGGAVLAWCNLPVRGWARVREQSCRERRAHRRAGAQARMGKARGCARRAHGRVDGWRGVCVHRQV